MLVVAVYALRFRDNDIKYALPALVVVPLQLRGAEVVQEADARFVASFGRGQRRIVGVDRVRDPLSYFFASGSDRGGQLDVVGYLLSRFRCPPRHFPL